MWPCASYFVAYVAATSLLRDGLSLADKTKLEHINVPPTMSVSSETDAHVTMLHISASILAGFFYYKMYNSVRDCEG